MTQAEAIAAKIAADIVVDTIQWMADRAGLPFETTVAAILEGGNALAQYNQLISVANNCVRTH